MMKISPEKEKIKASDLGIVLSATIYPDETHYDFLIQTIKKGWLFPRRKHSKILFELIALRIFTIDFAVYQKLGNNDIKEQILDAFYGEIRQWQDERPSFYESLMSRLTGYAVALKVEDTDTLNKLGPGWPIGKAFADYCKAKGDLKIAMLGGTFFSETLLGMMNLMDKYQIV